MGWRYELKYLVDQREHAGVRRVLRAQLLPGEFVDETGGYPVLSQYYDGPGLPNYLDKIAGIERRLKVRLRTYAWRFGPEAAWFLEAKKRENASIAKERLEVPRGAVNPLDPASWDVLGDAGAPFLRARELDRLEPVAQVWYQREVLVSADGELRVTWDEMLRALYPGEAMTTSLLYDGGRAVIPDSLAVLEVKAAQTVPTWLSALVARASLETESVSKYVRAMIVLGLSRKVSATC
ncbi:MAG TPA: polyphosphate polymerase domain-containing protein [Planctomycetota bacterium]|nr:polyphosphate polymerase domain-containing protein [Planctomycetota bacterium]